MATTEFLIKINMLSGCGNTEQVFCKGPAGTLDPVEYNKRL